MEADDDREGWAEDGGLLKVLWLRFFGIETTFKSSLYCGPLETNNTLIASSNDITDARRDEAVVWRSCCFSALRSMMLENNCGRQELAN